MSRRLSKPFPAPSCLLRHMQHPRRGAGSHCHGARETVARLCGVGEGARALDGGRHARPTRTSSRVKLAGVSGPQDPTSTGPGHLSGAPCPRCVQTQGALIMLPSLLRPPGSGAGDSNSGSRTCSTRTGHRRLSGGS